MPLKTLSLGSLLTYGAWMISAALALASLSILSQGADGLKIATSNVGGIPVTLFQPETPARRPAIVIAHGFAGSQQLMQPLAETLARDGYLAITFDFAGHGQNPMPMPGGIVDLDKSTRELLREIGEIAVFSQTAPGSDGRIALVGHSMASELVVQYAMAHPDVTAVVAMSLFGRDVTPDNPRDLLVVDGAWEPSVLTDAAKRIVSAAAPAGDAKARVTYGDLVKGTGRRFALARGAEHIGVIYSRDGLSETVAWLDRVFAREGEGHGYIDSRGKWIGLLFIGLIGLASPLARTLPALSPTPLGASLSWRQLFIVGLGPALLTPLILWKLPTNFLPILLGDYLVVHFALYALLMLCALWVSGALKAGAGALWPSLGRLLPVAGAVAAYHVVLIGWPVNAYVASFMPTGARWALIPAMLIGVGMYFLVDEWATRGPDARLGGYGFSKTCFVASLAIAVALNPGRLFFLVIIVPVIVVLFVFYGLVNRWVYRRVGDPRAGALGSAFGLAWAIAVTFPIVS